ncbi:unnamed protein product [Leuciscus chuanchicus]
MGPCMPFPFPKSSQRPGGCSAEASQNGFPLKQPSAGSWKAFNCACCEELDELFLRQQKAGSLSLDAELGCFQRSLGSNPIHQIRHLLKSPPRPPSTPGRHLGRRKPRQEHCVPLALKFHRKLPPSASPTATHRSTPVCLTYMAVTWPGSLAWHFMENPRKVGVERGTTVTSQANFGQPMTALPPPLTSSGPPLDDVSAEPVAKVQARVKQAVPRACFHAVTESPSHCRLPLRAALRVLAQVAVSRSGTYSGLDWVLRAPHHLHFAVNAPSHPPALGRVLQKPHSPTPSLSLSETARSAHWSGVGGGWETGLVGDPRPLYCPIGSDPPAHRILARCSLPGPPPYPEVDSSIQEPINEIKESFVLATRHSSTQSR